MIILLVETGTSDIKPASGGPDTLAGKGDCAMADATQDSPRLGL
ncbi:hypothetical protein [Polaromonas sp.]|nr:hypothetical protein [Polaromonas sp.]